jgi:endonuclease/exonuclease/phosphatase (EEP) superfamily protein YafD
MSKKKFLIQLIITLASVFALTALLSTAAALLAWDRYAFFIPLAYFPKLLFLAGTLFFLILFLILKKPAAALLQGLSSGLLLLFLLMTASFASGKTPPGASWLLMSVNTNKCREDLTHLAGAVKENAPHFLCLQEVPDGITKEVLHRHFPSFFWCKKKKFAVGAVFPIACRRNLSVGKQRFAQITRCRLKGRSLLLASVHLKQPGNFSTGTLCNYRVLKKKIRLHMKGAGRLQSWARKKEKPMILIGDFNAPRESWVIRRFALSDAFSRAGAGLGLSWPSALPFLAIDHCLYNRHITVYSCETIALPRFTDHRGLLVRWGFTPDS